MNRYSVFTDQLEGTAMKRIMTRDELLSERIVEQSRGTEFYRIPALNYTGICADGTSYSEVIAEWLYSHFETEEKLSSFLVTGSHMNKEEEKEEYLAGPIHPREKIKYSRGSNRNEENIAKRLMQMEFLEISKCPDMKLVDYQVPINRVRYSAEGKADLVFSDGTRIMIGELKDEDSSETLLRAVVEVKTYQYKIQSCESSLKRYTACYAKEAKEHPIHIQPAVLIFAGKDSQPWRDYTAMMKMNDSWMKRLISKWNMKIFCVVPEEDMSEKPYEERDYYIEQVPMDKIK